MAVELRPAGAVVILVLILAAVSGASAIFPGAAEEPYDPSQAAIEFEGDDRTLWQFTAQEQSYGQWTLAINIIVYGDPDDVREQLLVRGTGDWDETAEDEQDIAPAESIELVNGTAVEWEVADGSQRWAYLMAGDTHQWLAESYQLHDGDYLGSRHHIRAYTPPDGSGDWTAMQAHYEHWDWFSTRHVVTSVEESQGYVEDEFVHHPLSRDLMRVYVGGEDRSDFDGWMTVVDLRIVENTGPVALGLALLGLGAISTRRLWRISTDEFMEFEQEGRTALLAIGIVVALLAVRFLGIGLERAVAVPPKMIAYSLYPILFLGIPVMTYLLARQLDRAWAFAGGAGGFAVAILLDYTFLGVTHLPLDILVHRAGLAIALGFIAVGGSRTERRNPGIESGVQFGVLLWLVAMMVPLLRHTPLPV